MKLILPLPPSVNKAMIHSRWNGRRIYSKDALNWFEEAILIINLFMKKNKLKAFDTYFYADMDFYLTRRNADSHNYKKLLHDAMQKGQLVTDDRYILDRTQSVSIDPKNSRVEITFKENK